MALLPQCGNDHQMALLHQCHLSNCHQETGWVHGIVNVSNGKELWIARRKHQHLQTAGKDHLLLGKRNGVPQKEKRYKETDGQKKIERGREDAVLCEKGGYKPDRCRKC